MAKTPDFIRPQDQKNLVIGGNFDFWQRGTSVTYTGTSSGILRVADRFLSSWQTTGSSALTFAQSTDVPVTAPVTAQYSFKATSTAYGLSGTTDYIVPIDHKIEGEFFKDISGTTMTFSFWFKASIVGTYSFVLKNGSAARSYVTTFVISSASTWQFITIPVVRDAAGTWATDNTTGMEISIGSLGGSTTQAPTLGSWQSGNYFSASTATAWAATTGATIQIAQLMLNQGSVAAPFVLAGGSYAGELALCQRYYNCCNPGASGSVENSTTTLAVSYKHPIQMRASPTLKISGPVYVRYQDGDLTTASQTLQNTTTSVYGGWTQVAGFSGLTANSPIWDRGNYNWLWADAEL